MRPQRLGNERARVTCQALRLAMRGMMAILILGMVGGCSNSSGMTEILKNLNKTLTSIAVLKKGGQN